jgi:hypothetical protein
MELGRVSFKERDIADLLTLYGVVDDAERAALLTLASDANMPGWWHSYSDLLPAWLQHYLDLEAGATLIRTYEVQFVPGLLQTEAYARAVTELGNLVRYRSSPGPPALVLGYGNLTDGASEPAVRALAETVHATRRTGHG